MKKYKGNMFLVLVLVFLQLWNAVPIKAELLPSRQEIRVGLTSMYSGKETLTILNQELGYGYCVDNAYLQETVLESSAGFVFTPMKHPQNPPYAVSGKLSSPPKPYKTAKMMLKLIFFMNAVTLIPLTVRGYPVKIIKKLKSYSFGREIWCLQVRF